MALYLEPYADKRVLVTGGAGAVGSNLVRTLTEIGSSVVVLDDLSSSVLWNVPSFPNVLFVEGSVVDDVALKRVFLERPQVVFHLAAFFANQNSVDFPARDLQVNALGTLKTLEYAALTGVERFVYASSGASFYGDDPEYPLREGAMSLHLGTPYQITKMAGEMYANFFQHHHGLNVAKPRLFNSYGPGELPGQYRNVIPNFIFWALQGRSLPVTGSGEETRDFTFVGDVVAGLLAAGVMEKAVGAEVNLGSGVETTIGDLAHLVNESTGNAAGIRYLPKRKWDTKGRRLASIDRARQLLDYEPRTSLVDGIARTVRWFRDNWEQVGRAASFGPGASAAVRQVASRRK